MNSKLLTALALATAVGTGIGTAEAGHVHFGGHVGGSVHVGGGFRGSVNVGAHWARAPHGYYRGGYRGYRGYGVRGSVYVGPSWGYYYRPYYAYGYYPEYVPSYYGSYYPVAPQPQLNSAATIVAPPELPKFGIGLFTGASSTSTDSGASSTESGDIGLIGRFRLTPGLLLEGELGKTTYQNDVREDRRLGASLVYEIGAYNRWAPYIVGGIGVNQAQVAGASTNSGLASNNYSTTQDFAEIGVGIRWAVTSNLHLTADIRAGSRNTVSNDNPDTLNGGTATARMVAPPPSSSDSTAESYTRARLAAILYF